MQVLKIKRPLLRATSNIKKNNHTLFVIKSIIWGAAMGRMVGFFIASQQANVKQHVLSVNKTFYDCVKERRFLNQDYKKRLQILPKKYRLQLKYNIHLI